MQITIDNEIKTTTSGVYIIRFSNGRFYIGCSIDLISRVKTHVRNMKNGFKKGNTCKALKLMVDFNGDAHFSLLMCVDCSKVSKVASVGLLQRNEAVFILDHKHDPNCLNWDRAAYGKRAIEVKGLK